MNTIGKILKEARNKKKYSLSYLENVTKIKKNFIEAIENEKWQTLPPFPTVLGFVKSLANSLDIDTNMAVAILKRDYPPKKLSISPKPDVSSKIVWSPRLTFIAGIGIIIALILGYLVFQYSRFVSPPNLNVESPKEGQVVEGNSVLVFGSTDIDAKVIVNNQPVLVDDNGKFNVSIGISSETKEITISAISRSGKTSVITRKIEVK